MSEVQAAPAPDKPSVGAVRANNRFDVASLEAWLKPRLDDLEGPLEIQQFNRGASNPTFLLSDGQKRWVLRKKPPGQLLASAHQVDREFRVMKALGTTGFPVPVMRVLCEDENVIGQAFYVMDFLEGRIFRDARLPGLPPSERGAIYDDLNATLARLHGVDWRAAGLEDYGRPGNYFERQIGRWTRQYRGAQTEHIPDMERLIEALPARIPADDTVTIAHGDYRPENVMFHLTEPRIVAVLDWELSTLGNPLADFTYLLMNWVNGAISTIPDLTAHGIPTIDEYVAEYCRLTGRDGLPELDWYFAYNGFRLAGILQGIVGRVRDGTANSPQAHAQAERVPGLANMAWTYAQRAGAK